jgi:hypothetical protein
MSSLDISYSNGIYRATRGTQTIGQGRTIESLIDNATDQAFPEQARFHAAEVIENMLGPVKEGGNTQIHTR